MGSSEEEKLVEMVHDFIEARSPSQSSLTFPQVLPLDHHPTYLTLQGILGSVTDSEMIVLQKVLKYLKNMKFERKTSSLKKWLVMRLRMDGFSASICKSKTSWIATADCSLGCDYEYIDIIMEDENDGSLRLIVDLDFNSQFELARPTSTYTNLLKALPSVFVGSEERLFKIVSILCSAAKQSLKERGLHIPPWRKTSYMQSKWISDSRKASTTTNIGRKTSEASKGGDHEDNSTTWSPPKIKPKRRDFGGASGLTNQFSNTSINCC
ncbi:hypothetical protein IFM89_001631 [Coptis chinensis]|uniref:Uncharacterized protein n=1 Tax=Coptis chinensis TaxID=261450 RepID=A0A835HI37_9MAGN|nr:hypothetical protein IFM89_001631 [Coptis chinensis]